MKDSYFKIVLEALAEKIDRLRGELFCRDLEIENLKKENEDLKARVQFFMDELKGEEVKDG